MNIDPVRVQAFATQYAVTDKSGYTTPFVACMVIMGPQAAEPYAPAGFFAKRKFHKELEFLVTRGTEMIQARVDKIFEKYIIDGQPGVAIPQDTPAEKRPPELRNAQQVVSFCTLAETTGQDLLALCADLAQASQVLKNDMLAFAKARQIHMPAEAILNVGGYLLVPAAPEA